MEWQDMEKKGGWRGRVVDMAVGVWNLELSDPWQISGLPRATHRAPLPPGAMALTGVGVRGLW